MAELVDGRFGWVAECAAGTASRKRPFAGSRPDGLSSGMLTSQVALCTRIFRRAFPEGVKAYHEGRSAQLAAAALEAQAQEARLASEVPARNTRAAVALRGLGPGGAEGGMNASAGLGLGSVAPLP